MDQPIWDLPIWSDGYRIGDDAIDCCHRDMLTGLAAIDGAIRELDYARAERLIEALADASSIHAQSEDECFVGADHGFPHETIDEQIVALRSHVRRRTAPEGVVGMIGALGRTMLSDIHADRVELARV